MSKLVYCEENRRLENVFLEHNRNHIPVLPSFKNKSIDHVPSF